MILCERIRSIIAFVIDASYNCQYTCFLESMQTAGGWLGDQLTVCLSQGILASRSALSAERMNASVAVSGMPMAGCTQ